MNTQSKSITVRRFMGLLILLLFVTPLFHIVAADENDDKQIISETTEENSEGHILNETMESAPGLDMILVAGTDIHEFFVPPPFDLPGEPSIQVVQMTVAYNPASCDNAQYGATATWPAAARTAFEYAMAIWGSVLNGARNIVIHACWHTGMGPNILGSAGATTVHRNFANVPQANTWYPVALANQIANADLNGNTAEIRAQFNANFNWYLGVDGRPSTSQHDLVTVALHEIGHGLGFYGHMEVNLQANTPCNGVVGTGCWRPVVGENPANPGIYDRHTTRRTLNPTTYTPILNYANPSTALGSALTSENVFWAGANGMAANGGARPQLHAPATWNPGSSYSHLGQTFNGTVNALMTFSLNYGEAIHHPGPVPLGMLQDMGWSVNSRSEVFVNRNHPGPEHGSASNPFITVQRGVNAVHTNGAVRIAPGNYNETMTIVRPMTLSVNGTGTVTIGGQ